ncbi:histone H1t [Tupaia chinensis]|uniref:histone H1t n=1 Tax=Tupaia chinensis TaxID=246437 RepID=UPI0003C8D02F|nr:histone H1t [Tupaia chinensis]
MHQSQRGRPYIRPRPALRGCRTSPAFLPAMSETAPAALPGPADQPMEKPLAKKRGKKPAGLAGAGRKTPTLSLSKLITEALSASQERAGMSLAALKKALAAAGYDVEKNNSRIKLGLKGLVSKGTLVQTKGTGASGSFKLNKKAASGEAKPKAKKAGAAKAKKPAGTTPNASKDRSGVCLAALKKALAAAGYDVEKNNSRIKLGLKGLVSKGTLVQTKGTGASGSFKLNKKATPEPAKRRARKRSSGKAKKLVLSRDSKSPKSAKANNRPKKPRASSGKKAARGERKARGTPSKQQQKSPAKARVGRPKPGKAKLPSQKASSRKVATKK